VYDGPSAGSFLAQHLSFTNTGPAVDCRNNHLLLRCREHTRLANMPNNSMPNNR